MVKTIEEKYKAMTQREHVLSRPDTYVGDIKEQYDEMWIYENSRIIKKEIFYVPGLYKIFDEVLLNARDNTTVDELCDIIKVNINKELNEISIYNNGKGIDIELHKDYNIYVPELIFGRLLTSSNYDDNDKRTTGGRNGYGAKLANIFSKKFMIEIVDSVRQKKYKQVFTDNMQNRADPIITNVKDKKGYTKITFYPDLEKFNLTVLEDDFISLLKKRTYDIAGTTNRTKVYYNDEKIEENNFKKYINLYKFSDEDYTLHLEDVNQNWTIGLMYAPENGSQISFVNGICTFNGGIHVNYILDQLTDKIKTQLMKKHKESVNLIKPIQMKEHIIVFINAIIVNPTFTSQTKETLKSRINEFGSTCILKDQFMNKFINSGIIEYLTNLSKLKESSCLKKTDGKKVSTIKGIPKLEDANQAGTKNSHKCSLILTEGDSAKALAMAGRSIIGSEYYGVFPLKGKLLNVRDATPEQLLKNEEINNIKKIIGLKQNEKYTNILSLRYGRIIIVSDQDVDGFHIRGLIINFIEYFWTELARIPGFITSLSTPIIKCFKGNTVKEFYNLYDYDKWKATLSNITTWNVKYYKGLATSDSKEGREYFKDINNKVIKYNYTKECDIALSLAFDKLKSNDRKQWLSTYNKDDIISIDKKEPSYHDFVHKELKHFSVEDNIRSIPSINDGLKPSQRKILYSAFKRRLYNKKDALRVSQFAGYVSDVSCYHHGEASLNSTIINLSQTFIGSNNINLLFPAGTFGTRLEGGKDHGAPRYIQVYLEKITRKIFREEDDPILNYLEDDGTSIEPECYYPIIPMILINGAEGIGTGYSTKVLSHNIYDIIEYLKNKLQNKQNTKKILPWYNLFTGRIDMIGDNEYNIYGRYKKLNSSEIQIIELPVSTWTTTYKIFLDSLEEKGIIRSYRANNTDELVDIIIKLDEDKLKQWENTNTIYKKLNLMTKKSSSNMHLFDNNNVIKKYNNIYEILDEYYETRLIIYKKRKEYLLDKLTKELNILRWKVKFIEDVLEKKIIIERQKKENIIERLEELEYPEVDDNYDYLIMIPLLNLSYEKIEELNKRYQLKKEELEHVKNTTEKEQWLIELDEF
jgi:DNA topoisomerase-2